VVGETDSKGVGCNPPNWGMVGGSMGDSAGKRLKPVSATKADDAVSLTKSPLAFVVDRRARIGLRNRP